MHTHAIPFVVEVGGTQITAFRYRQIDETRPGHCQRVTQQPKAAKRRKIARRALK